MRTDNRLDWAYNLGRTQAEGIVARTVPTYGEMYKHRYCSEDTIASIHHDDAYALLSCYSVPDDIAARLNAAAAFDRSWQAFFKGMSDRVAQDLDDYQYE